MFQNTDKKAQKLFVFVTAIFAAFLLFNENIFATTRTIGNYTVSTDGWRSATGLGENQVRVLVDKISLDNPDIQIVQMDDIFDIVHERHYTTAEMQNGTYQNERSSAYTFGSNNSGYDKTLIIKRDYTPNSPGTFTWSNKSVTLKWPEAALDQDGALYDVTMKISGIEGVISDNTPYGASYSISTGIELFQGSSHKNMNQLQRYSLNQLSARSSYYSFDGSRFWSEGVSYDTEIKLYKTGTNTLIDASKSAMAMSFKDIDVRDKTEQGGGGSNSFWATVPSKTNSTNNLTLNPGYDGSDAQRYFTDGTGKPNQFTESISIISGLKDNKIFTWKTNDNVQRPGAEGNYLYFSETDYGLTASATRATGSSDEPSDRSSSFVTLADARGFKYRWAGSDCGTVVGFIGPSKVVTEVTGDYSSHATITETDTNVLWRENKVVSIVVNDSYALDTITIDGATVPLSDLTFVERMANGDRKYQYVFNDVVEDHKISISVQPIVFNIDKIANNNGLVFHVAGAKLQLTGTKSGTAIDFSTDTNIASQITNISTDNTKLIWVTTGATDVFYSLPAGDYTLTELDAPSGYISSSDITFTVGGVNNDDNSILSSSPASAQTAIRTIQMVDTEDTPSSVGDVFIGKNVAGDGGDTEKEFTINLAITTCSNSTPSYIPYRLTNIDTQEVSVGSVALTYDPTLPRSTGTFALVHNWGIMLEIPVGCSYEIWEDNYSSDSYSTSYDIENIHGNASLVNGKVVGDILGTGKSDFITITNAKTIPTVTGVETDIGMIPFILSGAMIAGAGVFIVRRTRRLKT